MNKQIICSAPYQYHYCFYYRISASQQSVNLNSDHVLGMIPLDH